MTTTHPHPATVLRQAAATIASQGYCRHYLWDTTQAARGVRPDLCRVDVIGALTIALHGHVTHPATPQLLELETLLAARAGAPSLAAWSSRPGVRLEDAVRLLHDTAHALDALEPPQQPPAAAA